MDLRDQLAVPRDGELLVLHGYVEGQRREIQRFAEANGFEIVKWYREAYTGAEVKHRKVFLQMLEDARSGKFGFQCVICYDISRFGRLDNDEAGYYRHEFRKSGVEAVYAVENLQGDDTDDLIISTKQWLAREYSRKIGEYVTRNTLSRVAEARDAGRAFCIGRAAPYGYDTMYVDGRGEPHAVVRQMPDRSKEVYDPDGDLVRRIPRGTKYQKASTDLTMLVPSARERVETVRKIFAWYVEGRPAGGGGGAAAPNLGRLWAYGAHKMWGRPAHRLWSSPWGEKRDRG